MYRHVQPNGASSCGRQAANRLLRTALGAAALLVMVLCPSTALAQGFGVYEHGTCAMGRAGTVAAQTCDDGSAIYYNPAGLTGAPGWTISGGATTIFVGGSFTADRTGEQTDLENDPIVIPHLYARYGINDKLAAGLGVFVPYGLSTTWPRDGFDGSFLGYDNTLQSVYIQPTVAYQLTDRISIGGGLTIVSGLVELNQLVDLSQQPVPGVTNPDGSSATFGQFGVPFHTAFADVKLDASGATGVGGNFGVQVQATDWLRFGARYTLPVKLNYSGEATFTQIETGLVLPPNNPFGVPGGTSFDDLVQSSFSNGPLVTQDVETEITMPGQFIAGISVQATPQLTLLADYQWTQWSSFDEIPLDFENDALDNEQIENYGDTHALRLGAEYMVNADWTARLGFLTHNAAAPDETVTPLLPEAYRNEYTAGLGWSVTDQFDINVAYQYIAQNDRRGRVVELETETPSAAEIEDLNSGLYGFNAHLIGTTLTLHF